MKTMMLAAVAALLPTLAHAEVQGTVPVGTTGVTGTIAAGGPPQAWTVQLAAGQDYALAAATLGPDYSSGITFEVDAAGGGSLCSGGTDFAVGGCSFRAP